MRGGYGIFYDWFDANTYEQTLRVDGEHQRDQIVIDPTYPTPSGSGTVLPPSRIELGPQQTQPTVHQASIGYDRSLGQWGNFRTDYLMLRGTDVLRSVNINAPVNGVRPDPLSGNVNEIRADGERAFDRITVGVPAARAQSPHHGQRDVSVRQLAERCRFGAEPSGQQPQPGRRLGPRRQRHPASRVLHGQHAAAARHPRQHAGAILVGAALQHHHRPRRQRRHGVQRSPGRRRPQQRARRVAVERQLPRESLVQPRRPARRRPGDARPASTSTTTATRSALRPAARATAAVADRCK